MSEEEYFRLKEMQPIIKLEDKDEEIKQLKDQLQQKENIIKKVRKKLIKSKEYQAVKSLGLNSKMSILIELEEMLEKEKIKSDTN